MKNSLPLSQSVSEIFAPEKYSEAANREVRAQLLRLVKDMSDCARIHIERGGAVASLIPAPVYFPASLPFRFNAQHCFYAFAKLRWDARSRQFFFVNYGEALTVALAARSAARAILN